MDQLCARRETVQALLAVWLIFAPYRSPTLTRYTLFRPETLIGWFNRYVRCYWWLISSARKLNLPGRPRIAPSVEQIIIDIKMANPRYGAERIAAMVSKQLGVPVSESTVRNVLKRHSGKSQGVMLGAVPNSWCGVRGGRDGRRCP